MQAKRIFMALFITLMIIAATTTLVKANPTVIAYDRGNNTNALQPISAGNGDGVHFTRSAAEPFLSEAKFFLAPQNLLATPFDWKVLNWDSGSNLPGSTVLASGTGTTSSGAAPSWISISIGIMVPQDFTIAFYVQSPQSVTIGADSTPTIQGRSYVYLKGNSPTEWLWDASASGAPLWDTMIRATVEEGPVFVVPEVPIGTIGASAAMVIALVGYISLPKLRRSRSTANI